jgi:UDP-N-acetylglucosamine acyltransferase
MTVHPTAIVSKNAQLGPGVCVGAYTLIGDGVTIGSGTNVGAHCVIEGNTRIGKDCRIFTGAVIGSIPQDLKFKGERVFLEIGDCNIIREYCTLNPGTGEGGRTVVGSNNLLMAYSHVAHDCRVGNYCVFANNATLAGHVTIEDRAVIGGLVAIHQYVHMGMLSIVGGCSKVVQDIPPYSTCDGHPAEVYGLNLVGLRRNKVSKESIVSLKSAFKIFFNQGLVKNHALEMVAKEVRSTPEVTYFIDFVKRTERGISRSCRAKSALNEE